MTVSCNVTTQAAGPRGRWLAAACGAALASALAAMPAMAQDSPATSGGTDTSVNTATDSSQLTDIVVTATRSAALSLQDVPTAIAVVNVDQITKSGQGNLVDLAKFTPSLSITESAPGVNKFNMRGLSTGGYASSDTSDRTLVAVYLDDTPISVQGLTPDLKVYDLERVEVLRGPQGTLYGAGSMAGTIRFVTAKPDLNDTFGSAEAGAATTDHGEASFNGRGMINLPLIADQLAVRANFYVGRDGGFIDNIGLRNKQNANRNSTYQGRVALRFQPSTDFTLDAAFTYEKSRALGLNAAFSGLAPYTILTNGAEGTDDLFRLYTLGGDYDLGFAHFILTGAYTDRKTGFDASIEPTIGYFFQDYGSALTPQTDRYPLFEAPTAYSDALARSLPPELYQIDQKIKDWQVEGRFVGKVENKLDWTVGVFYEKQRRRFVQDIPTPGFDVLSYMNCFYGPTCGGQPFNTPNGLYDSKLVDKAFTPDDIYYGLQNADEHQVAIYADGTLHVTDRLDISAGLRYFNFKERYTLFSSGVYGVVADYAAGVSTPLTTDATLRSKGVNPRGNISFHVTDDVMIYGEVAKGFRYGGGNQPVPLGTVGIGGQCTQNLAAYGYSSAPLTFGPDKLWNYTIGEKAKLAGGRVTLNASAYYIDWRDVQTRLALQCSYYFTDNKGKITSKGLELESMIKATPELTFSLSGSYNDSKAKGDIPTVGAFDGDRTPFYPQWTANVQLFYDRPLGEGEIHFQAGYQYQSSQNTTFNNFTTTLSNGTLVATGPSRTFAVIPESHNLSAAVAYDIGALELGIYGNNLANGVEVVNVGRATYYQIYQAGSRITYARPRTIGVRAKVKF